MSKQTGNDKADETKKAKMSEVARGENSTKATASEQNDAAQTDSENLPMIKTPQNIIQTSEQAWIEGTQSLQRNLIRGLQEYRTGLSGWKERGLLSEKRQQMITEVTEQYVRFLREEARITSDAALQARRAILQKELLELKSKIYLDIADMAGVNMIEVEQIFQMHFSKLTDPEIQKSYAQFVLGKIADLLDTQNLK